MNCLYYKIEQSSIQAYVRAINYVDLDFKFLIELFGVMIKKKFSFENGKLNSYFYIKILTDLDKNVEKLVSDYINFDTGGDFILLKFL